jgi:hypothetical protein
MTILPFLAPNPRGAVAAPRKPRQAREKIVSRFNGA